MYFVKNELVPIFPVYVPRIDEKTAFSYTILLIYDLIGFFFALFGVLAYDFFIAILISNALIFSKLISLETQQLNNNLQDGSEPLISTRARFRNILQMHQEMLE